MHNLLADDNNGNNYNLHVLYDNDMYMSGTAEGEPNSVVVQSDQLGARAHDFV